VIKSTTDIGGTVASARLGFFETDLVALLPALRAFSRSLCRNPTLAEDITQQALMKGWRGQCSFQAGTNLKAWLITILRNEFHSHNRRAWREAHWDSDAGEALRALPEEQEWAVHLSDTSRALAVLPASQREALLLTGVGGLSLGDAAKFCGMATGTIKSRVSRGRRGLRNILDEGRPLPQRVMRKRTAADEMLAQLTALVCVTTKTAHV
jgi:RNA polymerase sigma-70 factor (ECF subfamily)